MALAGTGPLSDEQPAAPMTDITDEHSVSRIIAVRLRMDGSLVDAAFGNSA
jgi:hypothetical protein